MLEQGTACEVGERPRLALKETPPARCLEAQQGRSQVEPDEVDHSTEQEFQFDSELRLVFQRHRRLGEDADVEVGIRAQLTAGSRAEEHRQTHSGTGKGGGKPQILGFLHQTECNIATIENPWARQVSINQPGPGDDSSHGIVEATSVATAVVARCNDSYFCFSTFSVIVVRRTG